MTRSPPRASGLSAYPAWLAFVLAAAFYLMQAWWPLTAGRLWAEEASVYMQQAVDTTSPWRTFFSPALGYYNLISRLQALLATSVPMSWVGPVSLAYTLGLQALLWSVLLRQSRGLPALVAAVPLSVCLANGEMLANSLLLSYWYGAGAALLMFRPGEAGAVRTSGAMGPALALVLLLSAGSGPHALLVLPAAAVCQWVTGGWGTWWRRADVRFYALMALAQAAWIAWSLIDGSFQTGAAQGGQRFAGVSATSLAISVLKYNVIYPVLGYSLVDLVPPLQAAALAVVALAWGAVLHGASNTLRWTFAAALGLQGLYLVAAIGMAGQVRYAFVPNLLLLCGLVVMAAEPHGRRSARVAACMLLAAAVLLPLTDRAQRLDKFAGRDWITPSQALTSACRNLADGHRPVCLPAWPMDGKDWGWCPSPARLAEACAAGVRP